VEGPELVLQRVSSTSTERPKISVARGLLFTKRRIEVSLTKVLTGPKGACRRQKHLGCIGMPVSTDERWPPGPMKPFAGRIPGKGLVGQHDVGSTGTV
jgi:hypothetical protein